MNKVTISIELTRPDTTQVDVQILRIGAGDDMVEDRADAFEQCAIALLKRLSNSS